MRILKRAIERVSDVLDQSWGGGGGDQTSRLENRCQGAFTGWEAHLGGGDGDAEAMLVD